MAIANIGFDGDTNEFRVYTSTTGTGLTFAAGTFTTHLVNNGIMTIDEAVAHELHDEESPKSILAALRDKNTEELKDMLIKIREYKP